MRSRRRALCVSFAALAAAVLCAEIGFRLLPRSMQELSELQSYRGYLLTGAMDYEPRAHTVYQRGRADGGNAFGFRDFERHVAKTPGVPRVLCLGGSTTESGNALGIFGAYPFLLEELLEQRSGRDFEVMNAGMSGWTTAEMLVSWFLTLQDFEPDVVVLHEAVNDVEPRFRADFRRDYSHWRRPLELHDSGLATRLLARSSRLFVFLHMRLAGAHTVSDVTTNAGPFVRTLAEKRLASATSLPFRRNVDAIATSARGLGATVVLMTLPTGPQPGFDAWHSGIDQHNDHLRRLCAEKGYVLADAERHFEEHPEIAAEFVDLVHLQPAGNRAKAGVLADALAGWLAALSAEGARPPGAPGLAPPRRARATPRLVGR